MTACGLFEKIRYSFEEVLRTQMKHLAYKRVDSFNSDFLVTSIAEISMKEETQEWILYTHVQKQMPDYQTFLAFLEQAVGALPSMFCALRV